MREGRDHQPYNRSVSRPIRLRTTGCRSPANRDFKADPRLVVKSGGRVTAGITRAGKIIDGSSGLFCVAAGHGRREIADAVHASLMTNDYTAPFGLGHPTSLFRWPRRCAEITPDPLNHIFFGNSGSEAIDTALKICMAYHRAKRRRAARSRFVSRERAYHGVNIGGTVALGHGQEPRDVFRRHAQCGLHAPHLARRKTASCAASPKKARSSPTICKRFVDTHARVDDRGLLRRARSPARPACLVPPKSVIWSACARSATSNGILLVFDDVICGFGRLGHAVLRPKPSASRLISSPWPKR